MDVDALDLKKMGEGVIERTVDMVLALIYFNLEAPALIRNKRYLIEGRVQEDLEKFNYQSLKRALQFLKRNGLVQTFKEADTLPKITQSGERKLKNILPFYDERRIWDGRIYLVTYDIPQEKNKIRDYLRVYLKKIGCGMLQQSIWLTPYNPTKLVEKFISEHNLSEELILVSSIGKNGTIGQMTLQELVEKVYKLSALNQRYLEFILELNNEKLSKAQKVFQFLTILKDDPQLPFALLPDNWAGDKAYRFFKELTNRKT